MKTKDFATAIYSAFLCFYPNSFREKFAHEMLEVFSDVIAQAENTSAISFVSICSREILELPLNIIHEYWNNIQKEIQMTVQLKSIFDRAGVSALALGLTGGAALVLTAVSTTKGQMIYLPYLLLMLVSIIVIKLNDVQDFKRRFALGLGIFICATMILYLYVIAIANPAGIWDPQISILQNIWQHVAGLIVAIWLGTPGCLIFAWLTMPKRRVDVLN